MKLRRWLLALIAGLLLYGAAQTARCATVLDFTADWCKPCRDMAPIVAELKAEGCDVRPVNVDQQPVTRDRYGVKAIPCFVAVDAAGKELDRITGGCSKDELRRLCKAKQVGSVQPAKTHFTVRGNFSREFMQRVADACERYRNEQSLEWYGRPMPEWDGPCKVTLARAENLTGGGGATSFGFDGRRAVQFTGSWTGPENDRFIADVVSHEVFHAVTATHQGGVIPRWADEGGCMYNETEASKLHWQRVLEQCLRTNRGIATSRLWAMTEYPTDFEAFYAHAGSQAGFLIEAGGKREFTAFVSEIRGGNPASALSSHYGYQSLAQFQDAWLAWVRAGSPQPSKYQVACPCQWDGPLARWVRSLRGRGRQQPAIQPAQPSIAQGQEITPGPVDQGSTPPLVPIQQPDQQPLEALREKIQSIESQLAAHPEQLQNLRADIENQLATIQADLKAHPGKFADLQTQLATVAKQIESQGADLSSLKPLAGQLPAIAQQAEQAVAAVHPDVLAPVVAQVAGPLIAAAVPGVGPFIAPIIAAVAGTGGLSAGLSWLLLRKRNAKGQTPAPAQAGTATAPAVPQGVLDALSQLGSRIEQVAAANRGNTNVNAAAAPPPTVPPLTLHDNSYVPYETSTLDKAWALAHQKLADAEPGTVATLKRAESIKNQILSGWGISASAA